MDPKATVSRIYKEEHYTLLNTKYESSWPCGFGEEDSICFPHDAPGAGPVWTPGARLAGFIKRTTMSGQCALKVYQCPGEVYRRYTIFCSGTGQNLYTYHIKTNY